MTVTIVIFGNRFCLYKKKYNDSDYASVYDLDYQLGNIVSNIVSRNNINSMSQADSASGYTVMTADQSGIVSYSYDGMESYTQDDMTPELFRPGTMRRPSCLPV